jgi:hypothetical protein
MAAGRRTRDAMGMARIILDVPDDVAASLKELEARLKKLEADKTGTAAPISESDIEAATSGITLDLLRRSVQALDIDAKRILVDGEAHAKVGRYEATYFTKEGPVEVMRSLYRKCGVRNGKTVDAVTLRLGAVDGWLPDAAKAAGFLLQQGTSREAEATARALGVLPYSRSSFERVAHELGERFSVVRDVVEDALIRGYRVPDEACSVSVSLDRVAVPFEEPRLRRVGRPKRGAPRRPIERVWHMAYVGTVTFHDGQGDALHTIRYGRVPGRGCEDLVSDMAGDVKVALATCPDLVVVLLSDGAKEMVDALDSGINEATIGTAPHRLIDFWHVVEKLGAAAKVIHGSGAGLVIERWRSLLLNCATAATRICAELLASNKRHVVVGDEQPVHAAITYLTNQASRMAFAAARAAGLPIGSGNVEATCKSLVGQRLVRTGSRWKESTAQHIIDLRALALSDRFDAAMNHTLTHSVRRLERVA